MGNYKGNIHSLQKKSEYHKVLAGIKQRDEETIEAMEYYAMRKGVNKLVKKD